MIKTLKKIELMNHALGIKQREFRKNQSRNICYRNYFYSKKNDEIWEELVKQGYATKISYQGGIKYLVTRKGMDYLERIYGVHFELMR